jgi:single-stranded-DNA-specific exonuclease
MIFDRWKLLAPVESSLPIEHPVLRSLAARRGIATPDDLRRHFEPSLDDLHDPALIHGMSHACERIDRAIRDRESILIYGDYDVDGVTSIVLLRTRRRCRLGRSSSPCRRLRAEDRSDRARAS